MPSTSVLVLQYSVVVRGGRFLPFSSFPRRRESRGAACTCHRRLDAGLRGDDGRRGTTVVRPQPPCRVFRISIACSAPDWGTISPSRLMILSQFAATSSTVLLPSGNA